MNRLNFEKMDKKKLESIDDVLYTVTEGRIVRRRKNPLPALLIGVAGAGLAIWSLTASSMSEHENLASMLMLLGGGVALVGLIMQASRSLPARRSTNRPAKRSDAAASITTRPGSRICAPPSRQGMRIVSPGFRAADPRAECC